MKYAPPVLVLDLDGTLVDSVPDLRAALNRLMTARGLADFTDAETATMVGGGVPALLAQAFAALGAHPDPDAEPAFMADYLRHATDATRPYPDVKATLNLLHDKGWRLALCTNKPEAAARSILEAFDLARLFDSIGGGDSFPTRKPDPSHLLATLQRAGAEPSRAVMAGDHANDVAAATGAGLPCIFAAWGYGRPEMARGAAAIAARFGDLPGLAEGLLRSRSC
jgi:phosphoglycolate phosphatase